MQADEIILRRYRLVRLRGRGGAGEVWEAEDRVARTRVALKVFVDGAAPPVALLARLRHPGLIRLLDRLDAAGLSALTMELADESLAAALRRGRLAGDAALAALREVAATLAHLHGRAPVIVHGDLKPDNVLLVGGRCKLADVGADGGLTPAYAAPERWSRPRDEVAPSADVYALGVLAHELLAGARPFAGGSDAPAALAALEELHRSSPPPALPSSVAPALASLVDACLAKDPAARPTAAALVAALG